MRKAYPYEGDPRLDTAAAPLAEHLAARHVGTRESTWQRILTAARKPGHWSASVNG
ncbi:hypothetical protein ACFV0Z_14975 [Streptomyces xiamenensis]|uniref:hypothetical protein n=1 Tax=Streptomyces xiamenensis TaxID=408015 RepID=UPI0036A9DC5C